MPYQSAPRPARRSSTARGARGGTPRAAAAAHTPRHPTRSAAQPASSCAADLLDTQHTRTLAPPAHCAAHCTPRQPRSTRRGARGTPRALPGGSARIASPLMPVHSVHNNTLTHARAAHALRDRPRPEKTAAYNTSEHPANSPHDAACALARACTLASPWPVHSETFSIHLAAAHRSSEDVSRSMGYRPSPRLPHAFLFTAISIKRKTRRRTFLSS